MPTLTSKKPCHISGDTIVDPRPKTRLPYFDNVKYILIALVVIGHVINSYTKYNNSNILYAIKVTLWYFHMPCFLFLSGFFSKRLFTRKDGLNVTETTYYLLVYLLFTVGLWLVVSIYASPKLDPFTPTTSWYLLALSVYGFSTPLLFSMKHRKNS